ncbi:hypothetical protein CCH79_00005524 [Gambusia affinis]|uniref:Rho-GAP domain-containing protein n=1 Tax=Gambusia affinis TaxID=33528 RepID=A0A315V6J7_GAMAF|nr:hypothetical protein CCH79_00005524 [Gambusia affinis]
MPDTQQKYLRHSHPDDVRFQRNCGEEEVAEEEAMRKSVSPLPGNEGEGSASTARVFGVPLEEVTRAHTVSGHEVPALVKHIVDYIEEHGQLDLEGLFLVNGNAERVDWLRQRYDSGEEVELEKEADLASAVSLLRLFLQELPEPVIPTALQGHILQLYQDYSNEEELCRNLKYLLQQLPHVNYGLLRFLCRFLASVASLQPDSWTVGALAAVFGPDIFHLSAEREDIQDQESVSRVLAELLDNQEGLFDSEDDDVSTTNDYSSINEQKSRAICKHTSTLIHVSYVRGQKSGRFGGGRGWGEEAVRKAGGEMSRGRDEELVMT